MDIKNVRKWCREFNEGRINVHDEQRSGRPRLPESTVARIDEMVRANRRITLEEIEDGLNEDCSHFSVHKIVSETLGYRKVSARNVCSYTMSEKKSPAKKTSPSKSKPKLLDLILISIKELKDRKGSSLRAIKKHMESAHGVAVDKNSSRITKTVKQALEDGLLAQQSGIGANGSLKLSEKAIEKLKNDQKKASEKKKLKENKEKKAAAAAEKPKKKSSEKKSVKAITKKAKEAKKATPKKPKKDSSAPKKSGEKAKKVKDTPKKKVSKAAKTPKKASKKPAKSSEKKAKKTPAKKASLKPKKVAEKKPKKADKASKASKK
ncbi:HIST1H1A [Cordylochernes scorpioides]|uniref:HIST1H1A n=2 Tax=Cordylochernes scorpioides TaxID=51811 RepID=A0ABY6KP41_9ARAC|nr:HIST1H1A [Cordylochernes scorpioides]